MFILPKLSQEEIENYQSVLLLIFVNSDFLYVTRIVRTVKSKRFISDEVMSLGNSLFR